MDERIPGIISSIMVEDEISSPVKTSGNLRYLKNQELGTPYVQIFYNQSIDQYGFRDLLLERLHDDNQRFGETLVIDKKTMDDEEILNAIREKAIKQKKPSLIRIADEGYKVTREDYDKLSFATHIAADDCVEELSKTVLVQNKTFKLDSQDDAQPVLERRKSFDELVSRNVFHINHELTDTEFEYLVNCMKQIDKATIELDYFNPNYYEEFLTKLQAHNVKENTNIQLIGYLLEDKLDLYKRLEKYPFEIDIVYSTCHDMVDMYTKEPYTGNRLYYSQVEGGGKTSLGNYLNVLEEVTEFEALAKKGDYSPLEIAILAKVKIDSDYIYDPDHETTDTDYWDNVNLSQMLHHEENGKKRAVCVGFATLFSAYCRRAGVPMFRYSTRGHMRSIGRIKDDKYGVDTIGTSDITWDLPDQNENTHSYKYFMGSPRDFTHYQDMNGRHEFLTIPDVFSLPYEDFMALSEECKDPVESFHSQIMYNPMGYAARLLELMELVPEEGKIDLYDKIYNLCAKGSFEGIPEETLYTAITNVLHSLGWEEERINSYLKEVRDNADLKQYVLGNPPAIGTRVGDRNIPVELITPQNVKNYRDRLWNSKITRPIYERTAKNQTTNQEETKEKTDEKEPEMKTPSTLETVKQADATNTSASKEIKPIENYNPEDYCEEMIPGTNIHRPRYRGIYESDEEYVEFLRDFYRRHFPNAEYVQAVLDFCKKNNINIYDYYETVGEQRRADKLAELPEFEQKNPFLSDGDNETLKTSEDDMIITYFADAMMKTIGLNISDFKKDQLQELFSDEVEKYNEEVARKQM